MQKTTVAQQTRPYILASIVALALLLAGALLGGVWHAIRFINHTLTALAVPFPLDGLEGTLLHEAWLLRAGEALYQPLQADRFVSAPYQPIHYVVLALFAPQQFGSPHVFFDGRLVSLGATLLTTLCLGLIVLRLSRSLAAAVLAMSLWLAFPPVQLWATRIKPDPLALFFTSAGLLACTFVQARQDVRSRARSTSYVALGSAALCFVAAYFTKQTAVVAPAAATLALLLSGGRTAFVESRSLKAFIIHRALRPALLFGTSIAVMIGAIWLLLDGITGGQYTFHVWGLHRSEWWSFALMSKFIELLQPSWPLLLLSAFGFLLTIAHFKHSPALSPLQLLPSCYLLIAPLTLLGSGETGANHNHLLETQLALTLAGCVVAGTWLHEGLRELLNEQVSRNNWLALLATGLLALQLWVFQERPAWYGGQFAPLEDNPMNYVALIRSQQGEVLADDVGLLVAAGRPLRYDDPSTMGPAVQSGVWDERTLLAEVAAKRFSAILMPFGPDETIDAKGRWSPAFIMTLHAHYKELYNDRITTYVPK